MKTMSTETMSIILCYTSSMNKLKSIKKKHLVIGLIIFVLLGMISSTPSPNKSTDKQSVVLETTKNEVSEDISKTPVDITMQDVELLASSNDGKWEVFAYLYKSNEKDEATLKNKVDNLRSKCSKPCMVELYDDKGAYEKNAEYDKMMGNLSTSQESLTKWKETNYVFVAEHYLGYTDYDGEDFNYYPFKDWYYEELKAK